jgi:hypothetical protein
MANRQESQARERWLRASELPPEVFAVLRKPDSAINPIAIVATVDPDGTPRTAPFGSIRAVTPGLLRLVCMHYHDTYANLRRDGRVMVALLAPPNIAVSIRGRARVVKERMDTDKQSAAVEIDVEEVKNDMIRTPGAAIESVITLFIPEKHIGWFLAAIGEIEEM